MFFLCNIPLGNVSRKKMLLKFENIKGDESNIDDDKNIQKLCQIRLLGLLLFHIPGGCIQVLLKVHSKV